jgi:hypothetical protein
VAAARRVVRGSAQAQAVEEKFRAASSRPFFCAVRRDSRGEADVSSVHGGVHFVEDGGILEKTVNFRRGGTAENVDLEGLRRAANERQRHHGIAEMVEFDDEETRFHRKTLTAARRSRRYLKPTRFRPLWSLCRCEKNFFSADQS